MSGIIDDLNESIYDDAYTDDSETKVSEANNTDMTKDTLQFEDTPQPQQRPKHRECWARNGLSRAYVHRENIL